MIDNQFLISVSRDGAGDVLFTMNDGTILPIADSVFQETVSGNNFIIDMQVTGEAGAGFTGLTPPIQHRTVPATTSLTGDQLDTITQIRFNRGGVFQTFNVGDFLSQTANEIVIQLAPIGLSDTGNWYVIADDAFADDAPTGLSQEIEPPVIFDPVTSHPLSIFSNPYEVAHPDNLQEARCYATKGRSSGKYYWTGTGNQNYVPGFVLGAPSGITGELGNDINSWGVQGGVLYNNGVSLGTPGTNIFSTGVLLDLDSNTAEFVPTGVGYTLGDLIVSIPAGTYYPAISTFDNVNGPGGGSFDPNSVIVAHAGFLPWDAN